MKQLYCFCLSVLCILSLDSVYGAQCAGSGTDAIADNVFLGCNNSKNNKNTSKAGSEKSPKEASAGKNLKIKEAD